MGGKTQAGMFDRCNKFNGRAGTVRERSHVPLHKRLLAKHPYGPFQEGISARQMERMLDVTCHRPLSSRYQRPTGVFEGLPVSHLA